MVKRGQAAMEFLMTYGWAILAVLITIAALAYFGILNPARFLPQSCTLFPGIACTDVTVNNAGVSLVVQNGLGQSLNPFTISIPGCAAASANNGLADGEKEIIIIPCNPTLSTNSRFKNDIDITYSQPAGIQHTRKGSIVTQVEHNYVLNGGFEAGAYGSNYWNYWHSGSAGAPGSGSGGTGSIDSTTSHTGSNSFKSDTLIATGEYPLIYAGIGTNPPTFTPNPPAGTYIITFWAKASSTTTMRAVFYNTITALCGAEVFDLTTDWAPYSDTCTTTEPLTGIYLPMGASAVTYWIDDVEVKKV